MILPHERIVRSAALAAVVLVLAMIGVFAVTGVGQDPLQFVHPPAEYAAFLLKNPAALRATIGLDDLFLVLYGVAFFALGPVLRERGASPALVRAATVCFAAVVTLDLLENLHFLVMLANAENGVVPSVAEIGAQVLESAFKFHVSYLGLALLGLAVPRTNAPARWLANLSVFVQLPVGVLIHVTPPGVSFALVVVRFTYFLVGLALMAVAFGRPAAGSASPA